MSVKVERPTRFFLVALVAQPSPELSERNSVTTHRGNGEEIGRTWSFSLSLPVISAKTSEHTTSLSCLLVVSRARRSFLRTSRNATLHFWAWFLCLLVNIGGLLRTFFGGVRHVGRVSRRREGEFFSFTQEGHCTPRIMRDTHRDTHRPSRNPHRRPGPRWHPCQTPGQTLRPLRHRPVAG